MSKKLAVVIGRFQIDCLHKGHHELIKEGQKFGDDLAIFIGTTDATGSDKNPLCFENRKLLFGSYNAKIIPLYDMPSDKDWSEQIDKQVMDLGYKEAIIIGGRDNSIEGYYSGKHQVYIVDEVKGYSSTNRRKLLSKDLINCPNFRAGIIYHIENRYPIVYSTVDVAIYKESGQVLMGKKGDKYNFTECSLLGLYKITS